MTLKKALLRGVRGIPIGVTIGYAITVLISLFWGEGWFSPVVPAFQEAAGTQSAAVALQFLLLCLMGFSYALASCIWEVDRWGYTLQTVLHLLLVSLTTLPIVLICRWAEQIPGGILGYFGIFLLIYAVIWVVITAVTRRKVREVNRRIGRK